MAETTKESKTSAHKEFEKLLSKDLNERKFIEGEVASATVSEIAGMVIEMCFLEFVTLLLSGSTGSTGNDLRPCSSDPPIHTRRGPG